MAAALVRDLTSKDVLPIWLHPETVGGRCRKEEASLLNGDKPEDFLARLGAVLRNATESQKFFRSSTQWSAAWWKCEPIALSVSQLSWVSAITHAEVVAQIRETKREEARSGYLAFFYDKLLRRQLAARAAKSDPNLDLVDSLSRIDRPWLVAKTRLVAALQAAGINQKGATAKRAASSSLMAQAQEAKVARRSQQRYQLHAAASMLRQQQGKGFKK